MGLHRGGRDLRGFGSRYHGLGGGMMKEAAEPVFDFANHRANPFGETGPGTLGLNNIIGFYHGGFSSLNRG
jgi:hypothetical protein